MSILRKLLFPLSLIYGFIIFIRNKFYDWGVFKSQSFDIPIISVGNLEVGGSGKTPMVEYLIMLLKTNHHLATLSRGYGRKTKGFRWVKPDDTAADSGDEPLQISRKFKDIDVAVCENRVYGINQIKNNHDLILMDDAYQHRAVKPGLNILLFDHQQLKKSKLLLPTGNYRESFSGKKRADIFIVTKCPNELSSAERQNLINLLKPNPLQKIFFTSIAYDQSIYPVFSEKAIEIEDLDKEATVFLLTGIAKPEPLVNEIEKFSKKIIHHSYPDHHVFSQKNMLKLANDFNSLKTDKKIIITTQKDAVRLRTDNFSTLLKELTIYEWPITINFIDGKQLEFNTIIRNYAQ